MKYTSKQKNEALQSIHAMSVPKTAEALNISVQTLYKWRTEANAEQPVAVKSKGRHATKNNETLDACALLEKDKTLEQKNAQLEGENAALRALVAKYRAALAAVLGEDH